MLFYRLFYLDYLILSSYGSLFDPPPYSGALPPHISYETSSSARSVASLNSFSLEKTGIGPVLGHRAMTRQAERGSICRGVPIPW